MLCEPSRDTGHQGKPTGTVYSDRQNITTPVTPTGYTCGGKVIDGVLRKCAY